MSASSMTSYPPLIYSSTIDPATRYAGIRHTFVSMPPSKVANLYNTHDAQERHKGSRKSHLPLAGAGGSGGGGGKKTSHHHPPRKSVKLPDEMVKDDMAEVMRAKKAYYLEMKEKRKSAPDLLSMRDPETSKPEAAGDMFVTVTTVSKQSSSVWRKTQMFLYTSHAY